MNTQEWTDYYLEHPKDLKDYLDTSKHVVDKLLEENQELIEALKIIAKGEGAFSRDPLTHAGNTIDNMISIAEKAIKKAGE